MNSSRVDAGTYPNGDDGRGGLGPPAEEPSGQPGSLGGIALAAAAAIALHGLLLWGLARLQPPGATEPEHERVVSVFLIEERADAAAEGLTDERNRTAATPRVAHPPPAFFPAPSDRPALASPPDLPGLAATPPPAQSSRPPEPVPRATPAPNPAPALATTAPPIATQHQVPVPGPATPPPAHPTPATPTTRTAPDTDAERGREGLAPDAPSPVAPSPVAPSHRTPVRLPADWAGNRPPTYPLMSRRLGEQGEIRLSVLVDAEGRAIELRVTRSSGSDRLDHSALEAVRQWRFTPATEDGRAVTGWYHDWRWEFRLER